MAIQSAFVECEKAAGAVFSERFGVELPEHLKNTLVLRRYRSFHHGPSDHVF